ncbi:hypothetical protein KI387_029353 [Taxus chinensis]|uniref:Syntaxin 6/10/61 N-terminal domain-containing protein n=1 Tax=Taxus chinensis TaxID=29808 RepID=A0AA38FE44_TAXCH|nr:hypothetical protein KI387_029353 [Taxus chinensis]
MTANFDRWEADPFFSAAEDVQDSADRLESVYRHWVHAQAVAGSDQNASSEEGGDSDVVLRRELQTALGTAKWQLDEFDRAVKSSYAGNDGDASDRHKQFVVAIQNQIIDIEKAMSYSNGGESKTGIRWIQLDDREKDDLASFLCGSFGNNNNCLEQHSDCSTEETVEVRLDDAPLLKRRDLRNSRDTDIACALDNCFKETVFINKDSKFVIELAEQRLADGCDDRNSGGSIDKKNGYRRTPSVGADLGSWKITIEDDNARKESSGLQLKESPFRQNMLGLTSSVGLETPLRWSRGCLRRWKDGLSLYCHPCNEHLKDPGTNMWSESNKKMHHGSEQTYGWVGAVQRKMLRSQYSVQYRRLLQITWVLILMLCLVEVEAVLAAVSARVSNCMLFLSKSTVMCNMLANLARFFLLYSFGQSL